MQWLIDLIIDYLHTHGLAVNRGDFQGYDLRETDLTIDDNWHVLDLTDVIPAGCTIVYTTCLIKATAIGRYVHFRTHGYATTTTIANIGTTVANVFRAQDLQLFPDVDGKVDYRALGPGLTWFGLTIKGWDF